MPSEVAFGLAVVHLGHEVHQPDREDRQLHRLARQRPTGGTHRPEGVQRSAVENDARGLTIRGRGGDGHDLTGVDGPLGDDVAFADLAAVRREEQRLRGVVDADRLGATAADGER